MSQKQTAKPMNQTIKKQSAIGSQSMYPRQFMKQLEQEASIKQVQQLRFLTKALLVIVLGNGAPAPLSWSWQT